MQRLVSQLADRISPKLTTELRAMIAITGAPGSGKSTLARVIAHYLNNQNIRTVVVPMDGFHLSNQILEERGWRQEKGSIRTFDAEGYVSLLTRIRHQERHTIYAPRYLRGQVEESQACAIEIAPNVQVVITEGNYLLVDHDPWNQIGDLVDESWFIQLDDDERRSRLMARHIAHGKSPEEAQRFTFGSDELNARFIASTQHRAQLIINQNNGTIRQQGGES